MNLFPIPSGQLRAAAVEAIREAEQLLARASEGGLHPLHAVLVSDARDCLDRALRLFRQAEESAEDGTE